MTDLLETVYCEEFVTDEDHPAGQYVFVCSVCQRDLSDGPCPDHAPTGAPGFRPVECVAEPKHPLMLVHDRDDYGFTCPLCRLKPHVDAEREAQRCRHWGWRSWRVTSWLASRAYALGVVASSGVSFGDGHDGCVGFVRLRGQRPYILGFSRETWRCWSRGHRRGEHVGFGFCGKCLPWPCCGSQMVEHAAGCKEAD